MNSNDTYTLFLDMLGFASAVEGLPDDEQRKLATYISGWRPGRDRFRGDGQAAALFAQYYSFHSTVRRQLDEYTPPELVETYIQFSDSVFLGMNDLEWLIRIAMSIMAALYRECVPARGGIATGTFFRFSFNSTTHPSGAVEVECPFLGTAVVRSYRAESSGGKGARVFVHPSVVNAASAIEKFGLALMELPDDERHSNASHELNLLFPTWGIDEASKIHLKFRMRLDHMRRGITDPRAAVHYEKTEQAITRMYEAMRRVEAAT